MFCVFYVYVDVELVEQFEQVAVQDIRVVEEVLHMEQDWVQPHIQEQAADLTGMQDPSWAELHKLGEVEQNQDVLCNQEEDVHILVWDNQVAGLDSPLAAVLDMLAVLGMLSVVHELLL